MNRLMETYQWRRYMIQLVLHLLQLMHHTLAYSFLRTITKWLHDRDALTLLCQRTQLKGLMLTIMIKLYSRQTNKLKNVSQRISFTFYNFLILYANDGEISLMPFLTFCGVSILVLCLLIHFSEVGPYSVYVSVLTLPVLFTCDSPNWQTLCKIHFFYCIKQSYCKVLYCALSWLRLMPRLRNDLSMAVMCRAGRKSHSNDDVNWAM